MTLTHMQTWGPPDEDGQAKVDRRYMELYGCLVDATRLDRLPVAEPLIAGVLSRDSLNWLHGKPGHAKSVVALDWACCVATGTLWRHFAVTQGRVLYIVAEGAQGMHERRQAWERINDTTIAADRLVFLPVAVQFFASLDVAALAQIISELQPVLIVVDTQARVTVGAEENSSRDMGLFIAAADRLRTVCGSCVLVVHHESRTGDNLRGSTALEGAATTVVRSTRDGRIVRLDCTKQKDGPEFDPILATLEVVEVTAGSSVAVSHGVVRPTDVTSESESHLLATLRDSFETSGASATNLREASGLAKPTFYRALKSLVTKGFVVNAGTKTRSCYVLTTHQ